MEQQQQQVVAAYKQEFQAQGGQPQGSDEQIAQQLKQQGITDPEKAKEAARKAAKQQQ